MNINFYIWNDTPKEMRQKILRRSESNIDALIGPVNELVSDVKERGDAALKDYAKKFEKAGLSSILATEEEFDRADQSLDDDLKSAIRHCIANVRKFHEEQFRRIEKHWMFEVEPGVFAGEQINPIDSVGLYVPRGKGAFPSVMYMLCLPAMIAGVPHIAVATPPTPDGSTDAAALYTAKLCGVERVYKMGGAQAIAALAYGTETVQPVKKIMGPGSPYVAAAKRLVSDRVHVGMPAGPSELIVLCDETAHPENTCLDLLNEAEHGDDSCAVLITHDRALAEKVRDILPRFIDAMPDKQARICRDVLQNYGGIIVTDNLGQSIALANEMAIEHLHLKVSNPDQVAPKLLNAGEILIGEHTPTAPANYVIGVNNVLPTGGWAGAYSCTSIWDVMKITSLAQCTAEGLDRIGKTTEIMADYEDFPAHANVIRKRIKT